MGAKEVKETKSFLLRVLDNLDIDEYLEHKPTSVKDEGFYWANNKAHVLRFKFKYAKATFGIAVVSDDKTGTFLRLLVGENPHVDGSKILSVNLADPTSLDTFQKEVTKRLHRIIEDRLVQSIPRKMLINQIPEFRKWALDKKDLETTIANKTVSIGKVFEIYDELRKKCDG